MVANFLGGDVEGARGIQLRALKLLRALFSEVNPIPVKAAMNLLGMSVGACRLPLVAIGEENLEILKSELVAYGLFVEVEEKSGKW